MNTATVRTFGFAGGWGGWMAALVAALGHLNASYVLAATACRGGEAWLHLAAALALGIALAGIAVSWPAWRGRHGGGLAPGQRRRVRFLNGVGILMSALAALVVLAQWVPTLLLEPCL